MQFEYYYSKLNRRDKSVYRNICECVRMQANEVMIPHLDDEALRRVLLAIEYDHPEFYYWDSREILCVTKMSQDSIQLKYHWSRVTVKKNAPKVEKGIREILNKCRSQYDSEYERFLSIYSCMARNIHYDFSKQSETKDYSYAHTILGVFAKKCAVCDGIAKAFKLVLERSGIDCIVVSGVKTKNGQHLENHAWNIVWIDDKPCHVDLTWAVEESDNKSVNHDYVCLTDEQIKKDHNVTQNLTVPHCKNEELDFYVRNHSALKNEEQLKLYLREHAKAKPFEVNVRLDFQCDINVIAKKAMNYIVTHFVVNGQHVRIETKIREEQNVLILSGE